MSLNVSTAMEPEYVCDVNKPIKLYGGPGVLATQNGDIPVNCEVQFSWSPNTCTLVICQLPPTVWITNLQDNFELRIQTVNLICPILGRSFSGGSQGNKFIGVFRSGVRFGQTSGFNRVTFHMANFPSVFGLPVTKGTRHVSGRIRMESKLWLVEIDPIIEDLKKGQTSIWEKLEEEKGFAITHFGSLSRVDGKTFSVAEADTVLGDIGRTLSFARSNKTYPILRSGIDANGHKSWYCWSAFHVESWHSFHNWFSSHHPTILESIFCGWQNLSSDPNIEIIKAALGLYLDAEGGKISTDSKLVLAQAALEGLSSGWPFKPLPNAPPLPSFGSGAAKLIGDISVSIGLPLTVPTVLSELNGLQKPIPNAPALDKVAWVRNSIAHLGNYERLSGHSWKVEFQAYQFAAQHLEMALLRLLDAKGDVRDRLVAQWAGQVQKLPWV